MQLSCFTRDLQNNHPPKQTTALSSDCELLCDAYKKEKKKTYALHFYIAKLPLTGESETLNNKLQFVRGWAVCLKKKKKKSTEEQLSSLHEG